MEVDDLVFCIFFKIYNKDHNHCYIIYIGTAQLNIK